MTALLNRPAPDPRPRRPAAPGRRATGSPNLGVGAATAAAVLMCSLSLHGVIDGWSWLAPLMLAVLLPLGATAGARRLGLPLPLIPVAGVAVLILTLTGLFASSVSLLGFIPGPGTLARADALLLEARTIIITEVTPVQALPGIVFLCCAGIGLVAVLSDTLAATLGMPATAGLGLIAVVMIPAVLLPESLGAGYFILAAVGYLLVLGAGARRELQQPLRGSGTPRGWLGRCAAVSGAALILALTLPLILPGFTAGAFPQGSRFNFWSGTTGLNPVVTLGNDLRQPKSGGQITYATSSDEPVYLRSTTLEDFSGSRWAPDLRTEDRRNGVSGMGSASGDSNLSDQRVVTRISSDTYSSPWLLAPYYPVGITGADGSWSWDPKTMTVLNNDDDGAAPQAYQVVSVSSAPTQQQLALTPPVPEGTVDPVFTDLPDSLPGSIVEATAEAVGNAGTPYAKAMAIQNYLRSTEFSYSLDAPVDGGYDGNGLDVLSKFLDRKAGYCVHFAAAMAVMARHEGIPSRMALGYAPGRSTGEDSEVPGPGGESLRVFEVDSTDAHAWPELYFEDAGWVRFEPTPSRGSVPDYAQQQRTPPTATPRDDEDPRLPSALPAPQTTPRETPPAPEAVLEPAETRSTGWLWITAGVLAAAAAACTPWSLRRSRTIRRRRAAGSGTARSGPVWDEVADLGLDYGYPGQVSDTPRSYADRLARQAEIGVEAQHALDRIRRAYEEELYSGAGRQEQWSQQERRRAQPRGTLVRSPAADWSDVRTVESALRRTAELPDRLRARFLPPSLSVRFRHE